MQTCGGMHRKGGEGVEGKKGLRLVFFFAAKKESKTAGKQSRHKGSKMRRKCVGNKVAGVFSCGQRDLCHLSEAQPQAGNRTKYVVKYGVERRNNISKKWGKEGGTMHDKSRHM